MKLVCKSCIELIQLHNYGISKLFVFVAMEHICNDDYLLFP